MQVCTADADVRRALKAWEGYSRTGQAPMEAFQQGLPRKHTLEGMWGSSGGSAAGGSAEPAGKRARGAPVPPAAAAFGGEGALCDASASGRAAQQPQEPCLPMPETGEAHAAVLLALANRAVQAACLPAAANQGAGHPVQQHTRGAEPHTAGGGSARPAAAPECALVDLTAPDEDAITGGAAQPRVDEEAGAVDLSSPDRAAAPANGCGPAEQRHRGASGSGGDAQAAPPGASSGAGAGQRDAFALMMQQARSPPPKPAPQQRAPPGAAPMHIQGGAGSWQDALHDVAMHPEMCAPLTFLREQQCQW